MKLVVTLCFAFAVTALSPGDWDAFAAFGLFVGAAIAASKLPLRLVFGRSTLALPFILVAIPLAVTVEGDALFSLPIVGWQVSREGVETVISIMARSWLAVLMAVVLTGVTEPISLIRGFERLHTPRVLAASLMFMYRYLYVIPAEGQRLMVARDSRSARPPDTASHGGTVAWRARVLGNMIGSLFLRSYDRGERIYMAMLARGYDGRIRFLEESSMLRRDWLVLAMATAMIGLLVLYAKL